MRRRVLTSLALVTGIVAGAALAEVAQSAEGMPKEAVKALKRTQRWCAIPCWRKTPTASSTSDCSGTSKTKRPGSLVPAQ